MKIVYLLIAATLFWSCKKNSNGSSKADEDPITDPNGNPQDSDTLAVGEGIAYYVATNGEDSNPGTVDQPWASWQKAFTNVGAGDTVFIRGGIYYAGTEDEFGVFVENRKGGHSEPICIFNYPGETPVLDCSKITRTSANVGILLTKCSNFYLKGLTVTGISQHSRNIESIGFSFQHGGTYKIENCVSHNNEGPGYQSFEIDTLYLINCDAYNNFDRSTAGYSGGQADGFVVCFSSSTSYTYFEGCRSWYNSDDGYDCWENEGVVIFNNCWSFNNGRGQGDGNGFKLGATVNQPLPMFQRILTNCLAFENRAIGFDQNGANVEIVLYNNAAFSNDGPGYLVSQFTNKNIIRNNLGYKNASIGSFSSSSIVDHNNWDIPGIAVSNDDFISTDTIGVSGERQTNNTLPELDFLKLQETSDLIDKGIDVGLSYQGEAPDLGAYEKTPLSTGI